MSPFRTLVRSALRTTTCSALRMMAAAGILLLSGGVVARAQSSEGAISVAATILAAPIATPTPRVTLAAAGSDHALVRVGSTSPNALRTNSQFFRLTRGEDVAGHTAGRDGTTFHASVTELRLPASSKAASLHLERLIIAGT